MVDKNYLKPALESLCRYFELSTTAFYDLLHFDADDVPLEECLVALEHQLILTQVDECDNGDHAYLWMTATDLGLIIPDVVNPDSPEQAIPDDAELFQLSQRNSRDIGGQIQHKLSNHWFWSAVNTHRFSYVYVVLASVFINLFALATSLYIMTVYDRVIPNSAADSLVALTLGVSAVLGFDFMLKLLRSTLIDHAGAKIDQKIGAEVYQNLVTGLIGHEKHSVGGLANVLKEFEGLREVFASVTVVAIVDLPFILLFMLVIFMVGGSLVMVPLILVPLVLITGLLVQPFLARYTREAYENGQSKQSILVETISGIDTVNTIPGQQFLRRRWSDSLLHHAQASNKSRFVSQIATNVAMSAQYVMQVAIVFFGVFLIIAGELSMGALIACVIISGRIVAPLNQVSNLLTRFHYARESYRSLDTLMTSQHGIYQSQSLAPDNLDGSVEFQDVSFSYDDGREILKGVSFKVEPGDKVAIVGRIGSGKSTLARLMVGLLQPDQGQVLSGGTNLQHLHKHDLLCNVGVCLQDPFLFSGTLRQNIAVGALSPDDAEIVAAADMASASDYINSLPEGFDSWCKEGGRDLSGGQRQTIALARAIIGDPKILVLDEPTSAMDMGTEGQIINNLKNMTADKTLILITHRPSLLNLADKVMVLENGRIIAYGPRQQVLGSLQKVDSDKVARAGTVSN